MKTRAYDARLSIGRLLATVISIFSALRNLFVSPRSKRNALQIHTHRLTTMAEWKAVTEAGS